MCQGKSLFCKPNTIPEELKSRSNTNSTERECDMLCEKVDNYDKNEIRYLINNKCGEPPVGKKFKDISINKNTKCPNYNCNNCLVGIEFI